MLKSSSIFIAYSIASDKNSSEKSDKNLTKAENISLWKNFFLINICAKTFELAGPYLEYSPPSMKFKCIIFSYLNNEGLLKVRTSEVF